jgi:repressor LexA
MDIGKRIKQKREELGWSQEELANKVGYKSRSSINKIEIDGRGLPQSKIVAFAKALNTTPAYLMGWDDVSSIHSSSNFDNRKNAVAIPVLGRVAAGVPIEAVTDIRGWEDVTAKMFNAKEYFALEIHGDSMEPRMYEGDVVIVKQQPDAESGDIVIATVNGDDATCKRLVKYADSIALVSLNPKYGPMVFSKEDVEQKPVRIIGKVVELRGKL